jgi:hypothetical protein
MIGLKVPILDLRERDLTKPNQGGSSNRLGRPLIAADQQTVSHLQKPLGVAPRKPRDLVERQLTVAHLAKPLGSTGSQGGSQPNTPIPNQAPKSTDKK